jgi:hypothetical protein
VYVAPILPLRSTLTKQFQEIQLISMPQRTDKQDSFAVTSSVSGFDFNITDGVDGTQIPSKALPYKMNQKPEVLGCWRAHLNIWEDMVRRHVTSTLVFEDDADWDVGLRAQMIELAKGSRYSLGETSETPHSPYGDDWDLLWIGHCGSAPAPWSERRYVIHSDPTVEPPEKRTGVGRPDMTRYENGPDGDASTRIIFPAIGGVCTASYAISLKGARKALYRLSMSPNDSPVDWGMNSLCADKDLNFNCVSTFPPIVGLYRPAGNLSRNSDIGYGNEADLAVAEEGHSERLVFSTRANLDRIFRGEKSFRSTYPNSTGEYMALDDIMSATGSPLMLPPKPEYALYTSEDYRQLHWDWDNVNLE